MSTVIKAGNSTTGGTFTPDSTGTLEFKTGTGTGTTAMTIDASQNVTIVGSITASGGISGSGSPQIQPITASVAANALTITLNATYLSFRSATLTSGTVVTRTISSPISVVVPSGATLGTVSAQTSKLVVVAIDNAGTVELAVANITGGIDLSETALVSTTAITSGATSSTVLYSTSARTNVACRVVGYVESTQTTAGTWATAPSTIQGMGGQALVGMSTIGYSQRWQSVTRTSGTTYYNTTGRPIMLSFTANMTQGCTVTINGATAVSSGSQPYIIQVTLIIPPNASYTATSAQAGLGSPAELR